MYSEFITLLEVDLKRLLLLKKLIGETAVTIEISELSIKVILASVPVYLIFVENEPQLINFQILLETLFVIEEIVL